MTEIPSDFEEVPCPGCDGRRRTPVHEGRDPTQEPGINFRIVRCDDCGLHFTSPRPVLSVIGRYYPAEYHCYKPDAGPAAGKQGSIRNLVLRDAFGAPSARPTGLGRALARGVGLVRRPASFAFGVPYRGRGRLLDFGCGSGKFLRRMHALGWDVTGMDFSADAVGVVRSMGLRAVQGTLPHPDLPPRSFDVVTLRHSLEHVPDPRSVLRGAWDLLDEGGMLLVQVPNFASWDVRTFGDAALALDLPRHLMHFTPDTLAATFERAGVARPEVRLHTRANWIRKAAVRDARGRGLVSMLRNPPLARIAAFFCHTAGGGNEIVATATKSRS